MLNTHIECVSMHQVPQPVFKAPRPGPLKIFKVGNAKIRKVDYVELRNHSEKTPVIVSYDHIENSHTWKILDQAMTSIETGCFTANKSHWPYLAIICSMSIMIEMIERVPFYGGYYK